MPVKRWVKRADAQKVSCPKCNSAPGEPCAQPAITIPSHLERHEAAIALGAEIVKEFSGKNWEPKVDDAA